MSWRGFTEKGISKKKPQKGRVPTVRLPDLVKKKVKSGEKKQKGCFAGGAGCNGTNRPPGKNGSAKERKGRGEFSKSKHSVVSGKSAKKKPTKKVGRGKLAKRKVKSYEERV